MRRLIIAIMVLVASTSYAQAPRSWPTFMDKNGDMKNVSASSPMPVDADVSIGSVSVNVFPVFADSTGNPASKALRRGVERKQPVCRSRMSNSWKKCGSRS